jgi:hypothetical protein
MRASSISPGEAWRRANPFSRAAQIKAAPPITSSQPSRPDKGGVNSGGAGGTEDETENPWIPANHADVRCCPAARSPQRREKAVVKAGGLKAKPTRGDQEEYNALSLIKFMCTMS